MLLTFLLGSNRSPGPFFSFFFVSEYLPKLQFYHSVGISDFDAQMSGTKLLKGDGNLRPAYKKTDYKIWSGCLHFGLFNS
jgi:hypothetical protein